MVGEPAPDLTRGVPGTAPQRGGGRRAGGRGARQLGHRRLGVGWVDPRAKRQEEGECGIQQIGRRGERNKEGLRLERGVGARTAQDKGLGPRAALRISHFERENDQVCSSLRPPVFGIPVQGPNGLGPALDGASCETAAEESPGERGGVAESLAVSQ